MREVRYVGKKIAKVFFEIFIFRSSKKGLSADIHSKIEFMNISFAEFGVFQLM